MSQKNLKIIILIWLTLFHQFNWLLESMGEINSYSRPIDDGCILPCDLITSEPRMLNFSTIYIKKIFYQVVFDYPKAKIRANYTLKNNNSINHQFGILVPFGIDQDIEISTLTIENKDVEYQWTINTTISLFDRVLNVSTIDFEVFIESFEEKTIFIEYTLIYKILEHDMGRLFYGYVYCLETSNFWNNTIESVIFEAWVPRKYNEVNEFIFSRISQIYYKEESEYCIHWFEEENWFPNGDLKMEYVVEQSHDLIAYYPLIALGFLFLFVITILGIITFYKKVNSLE